MRPHTGLNLHCQANCLNESEYFSRFYHHFNDAVDLESLVKISLVSVAHVQLLRHSRRNSIGGFQMQAKFRSSCMGTAQ
jgi:hypothetical protein